MLCIKNLSALELGRQGENLARTVQISVAQWYEEYGNDITINLVVQRPDETTLYSPEITIVDNVLKWVVTSYDTFKSGNGLAEIVVTNNNGLIAKGKKYKTFIHSAMS